MDAELEQTENKAFEEWAPTIGLNLKRDDDGKYYWLYSERAWMAWLARAKRTDPPSQRALKAAELFCREDVSDQTAIAAQIDAQFPAYLEIREALREITEAGREIEGNLDCTEPDTRAFSMAMDQAEAALAKAREEK